MSENIIPIVNIYPSSKEIQKIRLDNLLFKEKMLEDKLKHYKKIKRKWIILKNILHYSKYPISGILIVGDLILILFPPTLIFAIGSISLTVSEIVCTNILEDSLLKIKVNKYKKKCIDIQSLIDKLYVFKNKALKDGIISDLELDEFDNLLKDENKNDVEDKLPEISLKTLNEKMNLLMMEKSKQNMPILP